MTPTPYNKTNLITFGICLLIATFLWFLNALNREYLSEITYPVKYVDMPKDRSLISELPEKITLEVRAHGFSLLRYKISTAFQPVVINVNSDILGKNDVTEKTVRSIDLKDKIQNQFSSGIQLERIKPENIRFEFSPFHSKTIPVIPRVDYTLKKQYILKDSISIQPDSITISGPEAVIDTIRAIYTQAVSFKDLSQNLSQHIALEKIKGTETAIREVSLNIDVEKYTEARKSIPIEVKNLPRQMQMRLFPAVADVIYDVGLSRYDQIVESDFKLVVDYEETLNTPTYLTIQVEKSPGFITNLACIPEKVEYLIEKK